MKKISFLYSLFFLCGMMFHFLAQKFGGDSSPSMNLFVVAVSILVLTSMTEFREKLKISTIIVTSALVAFLSVLILLLLPLISEVGSYPVKTESPSWIDSSIVLLLNFTVAIILLSTGD